MLSLDVERSLWVQGIERVAGVDEAGRGPLAGPVVAAAVVFRPGAWIDGVDDSKKLTARRREELFDRICGDALTVGVSIVGHDVIDTINILEATMQAMDEAISRLSPLPGYLLIDGPRFHASSIPTKPIIDGDANCFSIAAASIVAKVTRDRIMLEMDSRYPQYGFAKHKGYGTREHLEALRKFGPCEIHRLTFRMPGKAGESHGE